MRDDEELRRMPKVELHRHLDGSVRVRTLWELSGRTGEPDPGFVDRVVVPRPRAGLEEVLGSLSAARRALRTREALERVAFENVEDAWRDGVKLLELRFTPAPPYGELIAGVLDGVARGMSRCPVEVGLIGTLRRKLAPEENEGILDALLRCARGSHPAAARICGIDLADDERAADAGLFLPLVERAREAGLGLTVHSGLTTDAAHVRRTLEVLGPRRIGHGIRILEDGELVRRVRGEGIHLEISPTSNWITAAVPSLEEHPLPRLHRAGVPLSVNSDDPHLFGIDLVHEYDLCARLYGIGRGELRALGRAAVGHSFLPPDVRRRVLERWFA